MRQLELIPQEIARPDAVIREKQPEQLELFGRPTEHDHIGLYLRQNMQLMELDALEIRQMSGITSAHTGRPAA